MEDENKLINVEKLITRRIIQEDAETIFSLFKTENNSIFSMGNFPYYALFIQSCQEYIRKSCFDNKTEKKIKDIRNYIKSYGDGFGKTKKRVNSIDIQQDEQFKTQLKFEFMKKWDIHLNLGTYWTPEKHIVGNTQMFADFLEIDNIFDSNAGMIQYELGKQIGSFVYYVRKELLQVAEQPSIQRCQEGINIDWYYDLNTNNDVLFTDKSTKTLNLFFLNILCNMNFVKYVLRPLFDLDNKWILRVEYIVTYYSYRAIHRLKNYCENNDELFVDLRRI